MNWQTGILNAALFASLSGCCIQAALHHDWKWINIFYWGSVVLIFLLASILGGIDECLTIYVTTGCGFSQRWKRTGWGCISS